MSLNAKEKAAMQKAASVIEGLKAENESFREANESLQTKVAEFERLRLAEDIAYLSASADGETSYDDFVAERDRLAAGDDDLEQVKVAMQKYGPGRVQLRTVTDPGATLLGAGAEKTAGTPGSAPGAGTNEPAHIAEARAQLESTLEVLATD